MRARTVGTDRAVMVVAVHGRPVELSRAALDEELRRSGAIGGLPLVEALVLHAPYDAAVERLVRAIDPPAGTLGLAALLALVRLDAYAALPALAKAAHLDGPLGTTARIAGYLLDDDVDSLEATIAQDAALTLRVPLVLMVLPAQLVWGPRIFATLLDALVRLQPTLGITAYRAFLGDLAEAAFRQLQHGATAEVLLGEARGALVDSLTAELGSTPELVAARGMAWLLGAVAPDDDAAKNAIERARDRFRDPTFHADCDAMLAGAWPPTI
ncbi:MAG: hypothetical protein ABI321_09870 [Polyangia bacterium]